MSKKFAPVLSASTKVLSAFVTWTLLLAGCARYEVDTSSDWSQFRDGSYPVMALTSPQFFLQHRPHQVYQYTYDLLDVLSVEGNIAVIAPWEYDPTGDLNDTGVPQDILYTLTEQNAVGINDIVLLDFRIDESSTTRTVAAPAHMGGGVEHYYRNEVTITLTIRAFPRGGQLARVVLDFEDDLFAEEQTVANPRPVLREGVREAARCLVRLLRDSAMQPSPGIPPDVDWSFNPQAMFTYEGGAGQPLANDFADMDELDRFVAKLPYYEYFDPNISSRTITFFEHAPPGLLVERIGDSYSRRGLQVGDYITISNGSPVAGPQSFTRPFILASEGSYVTFTVRRDDRTIDLDLPVLGPPRD